MQGKLLKSPTDTAAECALMCAVSALSEATWAAYQRV